MTENYKLKDLLSDLGKPTLRGVRKCPKCGTYNGTRGTNCKNKSCDVVFKESIDRRKIAHIPNNFVNDAIKVITGSNSQVYSVCIKEKGPDYRGFVQLPLIAPLTETPEQLEDVALLGPPTACCYVDSCLKGAFSSNINQRSEMEDGFTSLSSIGGANACPHTGAALNSFVEAQPLPLKASVLNEMQIPADIRQSIWTLSTETSGPLVQRLSKQIFVVKCVVSNKNSLGLLHISIVKKLKGKQNFIFNCHCKSSKKNVSVLQRKCVHFYSCICAFASDDQLSCEFEQLLMLYTNLTNPNETLDKSPLFPNSPLSESTAEGNSHFVIPVVSRDDFTENEVEITSEEVELLTDSVLLEDVVPDGDANIENHQLVLEDIQYVRKRKKMGDPPKCFTVQLNGEESSLPSFFSLTDCASLLTPSIASTNSIHQLTTNSAEMTTNSPEKTISLKPAILKRSQIAPAPKKINKPKTNFIEEATLVSQTFLEWLSSVTERINQTMHFQFTGTPETLVFHVPQPFFDCLQQRISTGTRKKRVPNTMTGFVRKDGLPVGTFTRYTWHITNILHVKSIFDTPKVPLEVTRTFIRNRDGSYELFTQPAINGVVGGEEFLELTENFCKTSKSPLIKPVEYRTLLKVGIMSTTQKEPFSFNIEWIPDILPKCQIGELHIKFDYGHLKNGQPIDWKSVIQSTFAKRNEDADATAKLTELASS